MSLQNLLPTLIFLLLFVPLETKTAPQSDQTKATNESATASCPVTIPRKALITPFEQLQFFGYAMAHWHGKLYVGALWPDGTIIFKPGGPGFIFPDGSLGMKIGWYRAAELRGRLSIYGKRLDAPAPPLRARITGHSETGFQATTVIFPTEGCWEVTGEVAHTSVTFLTRVVKVGEVI